MMLAYGALIGTLAGLAGGWFYLVRLFRKHINF